jgi:hypothetical protein
MSRHTLCPKFNGGNWMIEKDSRWWGGGYWHQNTREIFWPTYGANHVELAEPFFELYGRAAACARQNGRVGPGVDGPADGYTLEVSTDGVTWNPAADRPTTHAAPVGQIEVLPSPVSARRLRLRLLGRYNGPIRLDEITVYGK